MVTHRCRPRVQDDRSVSVAFGCGVPEGPPEARVVIEREHLILPCGPLPGLGQLCDAIWMGAGEIAGLSWIRRDVIKLPGRLLEAGMGAAASNNFPAPLVVRQVALALKVLLMVIRWNIAISQRGKERHSRDRHHGASVAAGRRFETDHVEERR